MMSLKGELGPLLKDSYAVINELQRAADMANVKRELLKQSHQAINRLKALNTYFHEIVDSFDLRAKDMVDTITSLKMKTLDSHSSELLQCLEYLSKMCVITENLLKMQDNSESALEFAPKLKQELSSGLKDCKELNQIDYGMFSSLDLEIDTTWLFKASFLKIVSKSLQNRPESELCCLGFEEVEDAKNLKRQMLSKNGECLETDSGINDSPPHPACTFDEREKKCQTDSLSRRKSLTTIPERFEEEMSPGICKSELIIIDDDDDDDDDEEARETELNTGCSQFHQLEVCEKKLDNNQEYSATEKSSSSKAFKIVNGQTEDTVSAKKAQPSCSNQSGDCATVKGQRLSQTDLKTSQSLSESGKNKSTSGRFVENNMLPRPSIKPNNIVSDLASKYLSQNNLPWAPNLGMAWGVQATRAVEKFQNLESKIAPATAVLKESTHRFRNMTSQDKLQTIPQLTTGPGKVHETVLQQTQPASGPRPSAEFKPDSVTCTSKGIYAHNEGIGQHLAAQLENTVLNGNSLGLNGSTQENQGVTESTEKKDQTQASSTQMVDVNSAMHSKGLTKPSLPNDICLQSPSSFDTVRPLDMPFNIESVIFMNSYGVPEINGVFEEKITGGTSTHFEFPIGCCLMKDGRLVVADTFNHTVKILQGNDLHRTIGRNDGITFMRPSAVVTDTNDNIYVKDDLCVQIFNYEGRLVKTIGKKEFKYPYGLALADIPQHGPTLFVIDAKRGSPKLHRYLIREGRLQSCDYKPLAHFGTNLSKLRFFAVHNDKILASDLGASTMYLSNLHGQLLMRFGNTGYHNGEFLEPSGVAVDAVGHWLVADSKNNRIQVFTNTGEFMAQIKLSQPIRRPSGIHLSSEGFLYVVNYLDQCIKVYRLSR